MLVHSFYPLWFRKYFLYVATSVALVQLGVISLVDVFPSSTQNQRVSVTGFDVASVKINASGGIRFGIFGQPGGRFVANNVTVDMLLPYAFRRPNAQIFGAPSWATSDRFDIEAKASGVTGMIPPENMAPLVQSLLEDRFNLKIHHEKREIPVYELVVAKTGLKLKTALNDPSAEPEAVTDSLTGPGPRGSLVGRGPGTLVGHAVSLRPLVDQLSYRLGKPVIDRTDLRAVYDFRLEWTPEFDPTTPDADTPRPELSGPSLFTAIQEQLGLRLNSTKDSVDVIVIDRIDKPTEN